MELDYKRALQQLRTSGETSFEKAIFAVTTPSPFKLTTIRSEAVKVPVLDKIQPVTRSLVPVKKKTGSKIKVMFLTDSYEQQLNFEEQAYVPVNEIEKQLEGYFKIEVISLFSKMIQAMGLGVGDFVIGAVKKSIEEAEACDNMDEIRDLIVSLKPTLVITMGATATNILLNFEERLASVHGKFFSHNYQGKEENFAATIMPLFHPQLLLINPGMKRTAWIDMQKGMKFLESN